MGLNLLICVVPENEEVIGRRHCGHGEKDVVSFKVCKGPAGIKNKCMIVFTVREAVGYFMHFEHLMLPVTDGYSTEILF